MSKKIKNNDEKQVLKKGNVKKKLLLISLVLVIITVVVLGILFFINMIPSKYYGNYVRYYDFNGKESKTTYNISPLSVKVTSEYTENNEKKTTTEKIDYSKKGEDIIIKYENLDNYLIIDDDCLFIETSKDISSSKKYGIFYWKENSEKSDIYEIENKADGMEDLIEDTVNTWTRNAMSDSSDNKDSISNFYIYDSDEENDKTDLNTYEIKLKAAGGKLSIYYDRKEKKLKRIYFSGSIITSYLGKEKDTMGVEDIRDCKAILLAIMYILGNDENIELNSYKDNFDANNEEMRKDLVLRTKAAGELVNLFDNAQVDEKYKDNNTYILDNDKYSIRYNSWVSSSTYSVSGILSWDISLK